MLTFLGGGGVGGASSLQHPKPKTPITQAYNSNLGIAKVARVCLPPENYGIIEESGGMSIPSLRYQQFEQNSC